MNRLLAFLAALVACLCAPADAKIPSGNGTSYFVSPTGSDSNNGTSSTTPWQTVAKVNASTFNCGDTVLFQGGQSFAVAAALKLATTGSGGHFAGQCSPLNPFTLDAYGNGRATFTVSGSNDGIDILNFGGVIIRNINLVGPNVAGTATWGIFADATADPVTKYNFLMLQNINVGFFREQIMIGGDNGTSGFNNVIMLNIAVHDSPSGSGVNSYGTLNAPGYAHSNISIVGCQSYNNSGRAVAPGPSGNGVVMGSVSGALVSNCVSHNNGALDVQGSVGIWAYQSKSVIIQFSEAYAQSSANAFDGGGFDLDDGIDGGVMQYNYAHNNKGQGFQVYRNNSGSISFNNIVRYNVSQNNGTAGSAGTGNNAEILIGDIGGFPITGVYVYGNTLYSNVTGNNACFLVNGTSNGQISNNICYGSGLTYAICTNAPCTAAGGNPTLMQFNGNDYFGTTQIKWNSVTYATIALWRAAVAGQEQYRGVNTDLSANPSLTNPGGGGTIYPSALSTLSAYKLQAGSPMLNAGQNMSTVFGIQPGPQDFYGNPVPAPSNGNYDVGANQKTQ